MPRRKPARGQRKLPYTRSERFALLRSAEFSTAEIWLTRTNRTTGEVTRRRVRSFAPVYDLLEALEVRTYSDGKIRYSELARRMHVSRGTVCNAIRVAKALGVLTIKRQQRYGGQGCCHWQIDWYRVRSYVPDEKRAELDATDHEARDMPEHPEVDRPANQRQPAHWERVTRQLHRCGVKQAVALVKRLERRDDLSVEHAEAVLAVGLRQPGRYPPQVIYTRLMQARDGGDPEGGWFGESEQWRRQQRADEARARQRAALQQRRKRERREPASDDWRYERVLDAMSESDKRRLMQSDPVLSKAGWRNRSPDEPLVRTRLVRLLREREGVAS